MLVCDFVDRVCVRCGRTSPVEGRVVARCRAKCRHMGERVGVVTLPCCAEGRRVAAYDCKIRGRALPNFTPTDAWKSEPEASIFQPCRTCEHYARTDP